MTRLRPRDIKGNVNQLHELEALLNRELGANLDTNENNNILCRNELMRYLNDNNFHQHYGRNVNRYTIEDFIYRVLSERNNQANVQDDSRVPVQVETNQNEKINLDFLPPTKVMQQASPYDHLTSEQLVGAYNERFDFDYAPQQLLAEFDNDEGEMRQEIINQLLNDDESAQDFIRKHPSEPPRSFVGQVNPIQWRGRTGTKFTKKTRMKDLQNIVLNLYRDVV